jgi:hypothetical protein
VIGCRPSRRGRVFLLSMALLPSELVLATIA